MTCSLKPRWKNYLWLLAGLCLTATGVQAADSANPRSLEQIRTEVEGLIVKDVAWRTINWRTCLLDGLQESQRTGKPLMLWVFIDRPIDDERC